MIDLEKFLKQPIEKTNLLTIILVVVLIASIVVISGAELANYIEAAERGEGWVAVFWKRVEQLGVSDQRIMDIYNTYRQRGSAPAVKLFIDDLEYLKLEYDQLRAAEGRVLRFSKNLKQFLKPEEANLIDDLLKGIA
ncbi:MAG: hypothetical protein ABH822_00485, partial [Patescibacteria group bacterium]